MQENVVKGLFGAFIGAIIGGLVVFIFARLGFVSKIATVIFGIAIVWGYKKTANGFSIIGAVFCTIISAAVTYFVFNLDLTMSIYPLLEGTIYEDLTFWECFSKSKVIMEQSEAMMTYNQNFFLLEVMGVAGTVACSYAFLKEDI